MGKSMIPSGKGGYVLLNFQGMAQLLRSQEVANELNNRMRRVQSAVPGSTLYTTRKRRARAVVINGSDYDEANTGDLSRALDLSGGLRGNKVKTNKPKARKART